MKRQALRLGLPPGLASTTGKLEEWERVEVSIEADRARGAATLARSQRVADVARQKVAVSNGVARWRDLGRGRGGGGGGGGDG